MRTIAICVCVSLLCGVAAGQSNIQLFFSESDADPGPAATNPIPISGGQPITVTLYLWSAFDPAQQIWSGLSLFVATNGDVVADAGETYQVSYFGGTFTRWQSGVYDPNWSIGPRGLGHNTVAVTSQGLNNPFDQALKSPAGFLLVGEVTFTGSNGEIFMGVGDDGIRGGNPGLDTVTFGAGHAPLPAHIPGGRDFVAGISIPEPTSLLLLGFAAVGLRRR